MDILAPLGTPRSGDCPSDFVLSAYEAATLSPAERESTARHVESCERCKRWLEEGRAAFDAIAAKDGEAIVSAMHQASARRSFFARKWTGLAAAAAVALIAVVVMQDRTPETTIKGSGFALRVFRDRAGRIAEMKSGDTFHAQDKLRFEVDLPQKGHVMIVGVEERGAPYPCFPNRGERSVELDRGERQLVPDAVELDASLGAEVLHLVFCPRSFAMNELAFSTGGGLGPPEGCRTTSFRLNKSKP